MYFGVLPMAAIALISTLILASCIPATDSRRTGTNREVTEIPLDRSISPSIQLMWRKTSRTLLVPGYAEPSRNIIYEITPEGHVEELVEIEDALFVSILSEDTTTGAITLFVDTDDREFRLLEVDRQGELQVLATQLGILIETMGVVDPANGDVVVPCIERSSTEELPNLCRVKRDGDFATFSAETGSRVRRVAPARNTGEMLVLRYRSDISYWDVVRMNLAGGNDDVEFSIFSGDMPWDIVDDQIGNGILVSLADVDKERVRVERHDGDGAVEVVYSVDGTIRNPTLAQDPDTGTIYIGIDLSDGPLQIFKVGRGF